MLDILLIGDVHCKNIKYETIIQNHHGKSIQLGDFGYDTEHKWMLKYKDCENHKILFGNHDYYPLVHDAHSLGDYGMYEGLFFVRGAETPYFARPHLMRGCEWFPDEEELSSSQMNNAFELYMQEKPDVVISHDCPDFLRSRWFDLTERESSQTSNFLDAMFDAHQPKFWFFGHHHKSLNEVIKGCHFQCLAELETVLI